MFNLKIQSRIENLTATPDQEARAVHDIYHIENFKIVGRSAPFPTVLEAYAYYLVRPEYREDVKRLVMRSTG